MVKIDPRLFTRDPRQLFTLFEAICVTHSKKTRTRTHEYNTLATGPTRTKCRKPGLEFAKTRLETIISGSTTTSNRHKNPLNISK